MGAQPASLIIACGALAHEIVALRKLNGWPHLVVQCLPADLHNHPEKIPEAVRAKIHAARGRFSAIFVAYADCGTGGQLDAVLAQEKVERIAGAHCYEFFAGSAQFEALAEAEIGSFYLTDFLLKHFDRLILQALGIQQHPELLNVYFGNYKKLIYLAQVATPEKIAAAQLAAKHLGLEFDYLLTGYGGLASSLQQVASNSTTRTITWQN
jgi:hypothetical protein